jgi:hypothetical protein
MGRQVSFVLTWEDSEALFLEFRTRLDFVIIHSRTAKDEPRILDTPHCNENGRYWLYLFLTQPHRISEVIMRKVAKQDYWTIDDLRSPVVEFTHSFTDATRIRVGRLWYESTYYGENGELVTKPKDFLDWADRILKITRRTLTKDGNYYFGKEALEKVKSKELELLT